MVKKRDYVILIAVGLVLGFLAIRQYYASREVTRLTKSEQKELIALEVSRLTKANTDLRLEIKNLAASHEEYQKSLKEKKSAQETLEKDLEKYKIIAGATKVEGEGVLIKIGGDLTKEQTVDLINAIRNIGVETMSLNKKRIVLETSFSEIKNPSEIEIIGNAPLIKEALERSGGIIEQIKSTEKDIEIKIEKKDKLMLDKI